MSVRVGSSSVALTGPCGRLASRMTGHEDAVFHAVVTPFDECGGSSCAWGRVRLPVLVAVASLRVWHRVRVAAEGCHGTRGDCTFAALARAVFRDAAHGPVRS